MNRRWILWLLVIGFVWVIFSRYAQIKDLAQTLAAGAWQWVAVAALLQVIYYWVISVSFQAAFYTVEVKSRVRDLLPVTLAALFISVVVPVTGMAGVALFVDDANRRGESPSRAAAGTLLQLAANFLALTLILVGGMVYLFFQGNLKAYEVIAALILAAITAMWSTVLLLGAWRPLSLQRLFAWLQNTANGLARRFRRPPYFGKDWAARNASDFIDASHAIVRHPKRLLATFAILMGAHAISLLSLYTLFLAFYKPVSIGVLVAGYSVGILFQTVSPTPQGIGVVEGVMPLVFSSLSVPGAAATTVSLGFRGLAFWIPLLLGFVLIRRTRSFSPAERSLTIDWGVRVVAILTGAMGLVNLLSALTPPSIYRLDILDRVSPLFLQQSSTLASALTGFALLLLAGGLWRHKRVAWLLAVFALGLSIFTNLAKGLDYEEAIVAGLLLVGLLMMRNSFHARSDAPSLRSGLAMLAAAFAFTYLYGTIGFYLLQQDFAMPFAFTAALRQTLVMFTAISNPGLQPMTDFGRYFAGSIYLVGALTIGAASLLVLRPVILRRPPSPVECNRAQATVAAHSRTSLAQLTLFNDKSFYFSPGGSLVAFALKSRSAVALGDPIGSPQDIPLAIAGFRDHCVRNDWQPAFYLTLPDYLEAYQAAGFKSVYMGMEASVDLTTLPDMGTDNPELMAAYTTLLAGGHQAEVLLPPIPELAITTTRAVSNEWLTETHSRERRFALGCFDEDVLRNFPLILVRTPIGTVSAFASLLPDFRGEEISFDLLRHNRIIAGGTLEFLLVSLLQWAKQQGYQRFNLGLAGPADLEILLELPPNPNIPPTVDEHMRRFYSYKGSAAFKQLFNPTWSPRYLAYASTVSLKATCQAISRLVGDEGGVIELSKLRSDG